MHQFSDSRPAGAPARSQKLIQSNVTKAFLTSAGTWTKHIQKACRFPDSFAAHAATPRRAWHHIHIYYSFDPDKASPWDFAIPVP